MNTLTRFIAPLAALLITGCGTGNQWNLESPDGTVGICAQMEPGEGTTEETGKIVFSVCSGETIVLDKVQLGLEFLESGPMMEGLLVTGVEYSSGDETWERVWGRSRVVRDHYNQLVVSVEELTEPARKMEIHFRAYDGGVAFRYMIPEQEGMENFKINRELTTFTFPEDFGVWATIYGGTYSHQENEFLPMKLSEMGKSHLPLIVNTGEGGWMAVTEANLTDWSGMHLVPNSTKTHTLGLQLQPRDDNPEVFVKGHAPASSPWRVVMMEETPGKFLESDLIQNLNEPCQIEDVSWITPGKSAWDWWWCNRYAPDAGFELGSNQETMKYFIDFASEMGWEYQLVDWHWYGVPFAPTETFNNNPNPDVDITTCNPDIDIPALVAYADSKNVKLLLWLEWNHADWQMEEAFPLYEKWGVAGVKIDFMASESQEMVDFYHRAVKLAAKHHLVVDFHGAYKPTGFSRTYPNLVTREGVLGNEYTKWSDRITPEHTVTLAFTRNILGEMDFTPGAFVNVTPADFKLETESPTPTVMATRTNQLAMMVVFESALQVICDSPDNYRKSPAGLDFLKIVPTTWDETRVLNEQMGDYITVARRSGDEWFIGSMTDGDGRELEIPLSFLASGNYKATIWQDGEDAGEHPANLVREEQTVGAGDVIHARLASGGGHVVYIQPVNQ